MQPKTLFLFALVLAFSPDVLQASEASPRPVLHRPVAFDVSAPLRDLAALPEPVPYNLHTVDVPLSMKFQPAGGSRSIDRVEQRSAGTPVSATIGVNVSAVPDVGQIGGNPDQNLAIGDTQVVVWVNSYYAVFDKATGAEIAGPFLGSSLWAGFGQICGTYPYPSRDIIVQWDRVHHRWLFSFSTGISPYYMCVAVSQSADATGSYYRYQYNAEAGVQLPDYPKWGIWTDAYYQAQNNFHGVLFTGAYVCAYNSAKLLIGDSSAEQICFQLSSTDFTLLPGDIDTAVPPPSGQDEFFVGGMFQGPSNNHLYLYSMHPDFAHPDQSTITGNNQSQPIAVANFEQTCDGVRYGTTPCVPQLNGELLYALGDRLMYRFAYTDDPPAAHVGPTAGFAPLQHWIVSHSVQASAGQAAMRWYEFVAPQRRVTVTNLSVFQQGTFAPDSSWRWMGSAARDKGGDILLGYSLSSATMYPAVAFTGRVPSDPLGTMEGEQIIYQGTGAQIDSYGIWGDYSDAQLDADGCTFWYVNEYYITTGMYMFNTRLASIKFDRCH